jgi:hypothetical protein
MRKVLRVLLGIVAALGLVVGGLAVAARFSDGPVGILPGGPLTSGELVPGPVADWSFATDVPEIELQLLHPPRSRTVWILVHERHAYIACGFLSVPLWKQWPHEALRDGRGIVRIQGRRYEVVLTRVEDPALIGELGGIAARKYGLSEVSTSPDDVWFFRLDPRAP